MAGILCSSGAGGVGSIPANSDRGEQNVPSFRRWRFEMKLSPFTDAAYVLFADALSVATKV
jgi:hypothetical protein